MDALLWWTGAVVWGVGGCAVVIVASGWLVIWTLDKLIKWRWGLAEFVAFVRAREKRGETRRPGAA